MHAIVEFIARRLQYSRHGSIMLGGVLALQRYGHHEEALKEAKRMRTAQTTFYEKKIAQSKILELEEIIAKNKNSSNALK